MMPGVGAGLLDGRTVIVTGAGQGIGRAITTLALQLGANVAAVDRNGEALDALGADLGLDHLLCVVGDVTDPALGERVVGETVDRFGALHGLVNNAGITRTAMLEKMTLADWQLVVDVHLTASFQLLQAAGRHWLALARADGPVDASIVNISSDAGRRGTIGQANYSSAKAGILGLTMSAAREWAKYGIRANSIGFGVIETPMTEAIRGEKFRDTYLSQIPLGRFGKPEEVAWPVGFLLSGASSYITGQHLWVNGGWTIGV